MNSRVFASENKRGERIGVQKVSRVLRHVLVIGGLGFLAFSIAYPDTRHETLLTAMMLLMLSVPMSLLSSALRD